MTSSISRSAIPKPGVVSAAKSGYFYNDSDYVRFHTEQRVGLTKGNPKELERLLTRENLRPQPPAQHVVPIEIFRWPLIRKPDFVAATLGHGFGLRSRFRIVAGKHPRSHIRTD